MITPRPQVFVTCEEAEKMEDEIKGLLSEIMKERKVINAMKGDLAKMQQKNNVMKEDNAKMQQKINVMTGIIASLVVAFIVAS